MTWKGLLQRLDIGPGVFVLITEDGARLPLDGRVPADLTGRRVVVEGEAVEQMGIGMTGGGPTIRVKRVSPL